METRWFELGVSFIFMYIQYDIAISICHVTREDLYSDRVDGSGSCLKDSTILDQAKGQAILPGLDGHAVLFTMSSPERVFKLMELQYYRADSLKASFDNHQPLEIKYGNISIIIGSYSLLF